VRTHNLVTIYEIDIQRAFILWSVICLCCGYLGHHGSILPRAYSGSTWHRSSPHDAVHWLRSSRSVIRECFVCPRPLIAGMLQNLLVNPPAMYWPATLVTVQLFTTLYSSSSSAMTRAAALATRDRLKVFMLVFIAIFAYQFLPFLLFPTLTSIATLCLINKGSWWMRVMGSGYSGLGVFNFSLDWSSIGSSGPLYTPYWALGNYFGGLIGMCWIVSISKL